MINQLTRYLRGIVNWDHRERGVQDRMFRLITSIGLGSLFLFLLLGIVAGEGIHIILTIIVSIFVFSAIIYLSIKYNRIRFTSVIISLIFIFLVCPAMFFLSGGILGGAPLSFVFCAVLICQLIEGKMRFFFLALEITVNAACYYIGYYNPNLIVKHTIEVGYMDSFGTVVIISIMLCTMIIFQNYIHESENKIVIEQKKEIEELNKAQNRFFSSMSHEIRTPINTIIGLNEMILREDISDEVAEDAKSIQGAGKMLLAVINDILDMSKMESGNMEIINSPYNTGELMSDIVNMVWGRAREKGLDFHVNVDSVMPELLVGDEVRIKQVLVNLLNNAVKYTSSGSVTFSVQCGAIEDNTVTMIYTVSDTGMGIKKENIAFLFDAFRRMDEEKNRHIEGTGLGLAIVKQLVDLMHGEITVNSIYTVGSTFIVSLKQGVGDGAGMIEMDMSKRRFLRANEHYRQKFEAPDARLLVVDDNTANLMVVSKLLRDTKIRIDTAGDGVEGLEKTLEQHYDAIFMDHLMPNMDGIECLHNIRFQTGGLNRDTPIIVLTANAGSENQNLYEREGFDGYLLKPVTGSQIEDMLIHVLPPELVSISEETLAIQQQEESLYHKNVHKLPILISTDSVCDIPSHMLKRFNIAVVPYHVCTEEGDFLDGVEMDSDGILEYTEEEFRVARSSPPSVEEYQQFFAWELSRAQQIIHLTASRKISKGYARAFEAANVFDNVTVVDSGHLSGSLGMMTLRAREMDMSGMGKDDILRNLADMRKQIHSSMLMKKVEYLSAHGKIYGWVGDICSAMNLHTVVRIRDGGLKVANIRHGSWEDDWRKYVAKELPNSPRLDRRLLFVIHTDFAAKDLEEIRAMLQKYKFEEIIFQRASAAVSINWGPGCLGLVYMVNE